MLGTCELQCGFPGCIRFTYQVVLGRPRLQRGEFRLPSTGGVFECALIVATIAHSSVAIDELRGREPPLELAGFGPLVRRVGAAPS